MIKISVLCSRAGCPARENVFTTEEKKLKKYLSDRLWIVKNGNAFCGEPCEYLFNRDNLGGDKKMRQVTVVCDGCGISRAHFDYKKFKNFKKSYLLEGWVIDKDKDFCGEKCRKEYKEDRKFEKQRKTLTSKKK